MSVRIVPKKVVVLKPVHVPLISRSSGRRHISAARVRRSILRILRANTLCSLATVTANRRAHINHVYFCYSADLDFYFLSDPSSLHCQNLKTNNSMAITVFGSEQKWGGADRGMQLFGTCREAGGRDASTAERLYGKRFRDYHAWKRDLDEEKRAAFRYRFYHFVPVRVKILDESEFGGGALVFAELRRERRG